MAKPRKSSQDIDHYQRAFEDLLEEDPADLGKKDIALLNLICAPNLTGSEKLDIPRCLARLDRVTAHVKSETERNHHRFAKDPTYGHCEPMWRMALLVTCVKLDYGAAYDPVVEAELKKDGHSPFIDSRNVFIHGLLEDNHRRRWGSCSSIPVFVAAVARRLGYPIHLAVNRKHVYARWDDGNGLTFNIEASNPAGMVIHSDEHYRNEMFGPLTELEARSGFYGRTLTPAEAFGLFLKDRVWCLHDTDRHEESFLWGARALQFSPDDPHFAKGARLTADIGIRRRYRQKYPDRSIPPLERNHEFFFNLNELTAPQEGSLFTTIVAHCEEADGELDKARALFEDACRLYPYGNNEQRDLQRFLRKHNLPRRRNGPLMPSKRCLPRFFKLFCKPHQEAAVLRMMIDTFEFDEKYLEARKAMIDLYAFDPCDAELFRRLRALERDPKFQEQFKEDHRRRGVKILPPPTITI